MFAFFDFPAVQWVHVKTTNPIESTFATGWLRTKVTKGPGSRAAGRHGLQVDRQTQIRLRMVNTPHLVVRAGVKFETGVVVERSAEQNEEIGAWSV